jgi:TPP-dependent pyruvate/acetoin dehydrogenase alpha subunit
MLETATRSKIRSIKTRAARALSRSVSLDVARAHARRKARKSLSRRFDHGWRLRPAVGRKRLAWPADLFLQKGDIFAPLIRDQAGRSAFGEPLIDVTRTYLGSRQGPMRGRDGNIHRGRPRNNQLAMISHLGAMVSVTVGALMAKRFHGEKTLSA